MWEREREKKMSKTLCKNIQLKKSPVGNQILYEYNIYCTG